MKNLAKNKDLEIPLNSGVLDGLWPRGSGNATDFRLLLNVNPSTDRGCQRMYGWAFRRDNNPSNEDLHDHLLGYPTTTQHQDRTQREAVTMLGEVVSTGGTIHALGATSSRIYTSTGMSKNWRILRDGLGGGGIVGNTYPNVRMRYAKLGDFVLFTNNVDPVMFWQIGSASTTVDGVTRSAYDIYDLAGLRITRAGCIECWNGFAFLGDVTVDGEQYESRVYWSDFNRPLEWAPGGESAAGYVDLGRGERVIALAPISGQLRCYTNKAIYNVDLVGGEMVFRFSEIYRGDLALHYRYSLANLGDTHVWLTKDDIVTSGQYDRVPRRWDWMSRAASIIFKGISQETAHGLPDVFAWFKGLDASLCHQVVSGWDGKHEMLWISWPTLAMEVGGPPGRMSMVFSPRYNKASLVDHGFTAFALMRRSRWMTIGDFLYTHSVCERERDVMEGASYVQDRAYETPPTYIWNATETPIPILNGDGAVIGYEPPDPDSLSARLTTTYLHMDCASCEAVPYFVGADFTDFTLKEIRPDFYFRHIYTADGDDATTWPTTTTGAYDSAGYPTIIQSECKNWGSPSDKLVQGILVDYDAAPEDSPGHIVVQLGTSNTPTKTDWHDTYPVQLDCLPEHVSRDEEVQRVTAQAAFPFFEAGTWLSYRIMVAAVDPSVYDAYQVKVSFNNVTISCRLKNETWTNQ